MRKYLLIITLFVGYFQTVYSQNPTRLLQKLPSLKGKERIDCLIEIAKLYNSKFNIDSTNYYCKLIHEEATKLGYKKAIALSLLGLNPESDSLRLQNVNRAIRMGEELNDNEVLGWSYFVLNFLQNTNQMFNRTGFIELSKKSLYYFRKAEDTLKEAEVLNDLCANCSALGQEEGFDYCKRSIQLSKQIRSSAKDWKGWAETLYIGSLFNMSRLYEQGGDYNTALSYMRLARETAIENGNSWQIEDGLSSLFNKMGLYDSSLYYLEKLAQKHKGALIDVFFAETYFLKKDFRKAQQLFQNALDSSRKRRWLYAEMRASLGLGKCLEIKEDYRSALTTAKNGFNISKLNGDRQCIMDLNELLSRLYHHVGKDDSAFHYLQQYTFLKDSASNKQYLWKLNRQLYEYKKEAEEQRKTSQINLLKKENQLKNSLIIGVLLLLLLGVFIFRNVLLKRKNDKLQLQKNFELHKLASEKKHAELQQQALELEMQALRAQMNPHFIFNCLSSINRFIFKNDNKLASDYLTRFSRLIRMVLMNSSKKLITLEDELEMLRLYLDLERLRFKDAFDYSITTTNIVDAGAIFVPPLLLQPFCENAVWHGLMHKNSKGHLVITIHEVNGENDKVLHCVIEDDGIGRLKAAELKSKSAESEKSLGLKITTERLALLNEEKNYNTFYKIEDILDENNAVTGTRVGIKIKYKESIEETVST